MLTAIPAALFPAVAVADSALPADAFLVYTASWRLIEGEPPEEEVLASSTQPTDCKLTRVEEGRGQNIVTCFRV